VTDVIAVDEQTDVRAYLTALGDHAVAQSHVTRPEFRECVGDGRRVGVERDRARVALPAVRLAPP